MHLKHKTDTNLNYVVTYERYGLQKQKFFFSKVFSLNKEHLYDLNVEMEIIFRKYFLMQNGGKQQRMLRQLWKFKPFGEGFYSTQKNVLSCRYIQTN